MLDAAPAALPSPLEIGFEQALPSSSPVGGNDGVLDRPRHLRAGPEPVQDRRQLGCGAAAGGTGRQISGALDAGGDRNQPDATDEDLAKDFITFASSPETNEQLITTTGSGVDPTRTSTLEGEATRRSLPRCRRRSRRCCRTRRPGRPHPGARDDPVADDNLALMLQGSLTPEEAMQQTQDAWDALCEAFRPGSRGFGPGAGPSFSFH